MAVMVDKDTFTAESLLTDLRRLLNEESYRRSALKISRVITDQPKPPVQQVDSAAICVPPLHMLP